ncbi:sigma 54-interacting transcriptional regulator [Desulfovibrio sp. OttesenSCG-928-I05]|nr:sigma 54-interacting transcriptional regulator [Desulfovibrio sp. OttesenSCG-928-I05]
MHILPQNLVPLMPILDSLHDGLLIVDALGTVVAINKAMRQFYQGAEIPFPGYPLSDFNPEDWVEVKRVLTSGKALLGLPMTLPSASALVDRTPLIQGGKIVGVVCRMQETGRLDAVVRHLESFQELDTLLDDVIEQAPQAMMVIDAQGIIIRVNSKFSEFCAAERDVLIGREARALPLGNVGGEPRAEVAALRDITLTCLQSGQARQAAYPDQESPKLWLQAAPAFTDQGIIRLVVANVHSAEGTEPFPRDKEEEEPDFTAGVQPDEDNDEAISALTREFGIIARSKPMLRVVQRAAKVSQSESSVLLQGESGVGKSMLAALIHRLSPRGQEAFVPINCGAIPEQLIESELFGYERGAFTGASPKGKIGLIESGNGGTVFFDEIGELSMPMQVKLLDVIDKKAFMRVGGTRQIKIDFRIVAATNRDLEQDVADGRFRKDLFYRINVIPIDIPPLRERKEDIMALALNMLARYNAGHSVRKRLSPEVMRLLLQHDFPGNARELNNAMEWMLVMGEGNVLYPKDMPMTFQIKAGLGGSTQEPCHEQMPDFEDMLTFEGGCSLKDAVQTFEKRYLEQTLSRHENMQAAARFLDVHPTTLWRKLTQHNILGYGKDE